MPTASAHPYFRPTTAAQRRLLFTTWQATQNVTEACRIAHVGRGTFYTWQPRFEAAGLAGLEHPHSRAPHQPRRLAAAVEAEVQALHQTHPTWGKARLAAEVAKAHGWHPCVSPNTVRRILTPRPVLEAVPAPAPEAGAMRHAEQPGQTLHIDLCFVPADHAPSETLPAVSGSSGILRIQRPAAEHAPSPGQIFSQPEVDYAEAMVQFVAASAPTPEPGSLSALPADASPAHTRRALRQAEAHLREQRRHQRTQRQAEDRAWRQTQVVPLTATVAADGRALQRARRAEHRTRTAHRRQEDEAWRTQRQALRTRLSAIRQVPTWLAVLVVIDSATRQCYGVPLFANGRHVTAAQVVAALRDVLPPDLAFVISDRGCHFKAQEFKDLATARGFLHVFTARHRPQSNGIAERFVRTFKAWLVDKTWHTPAELESLSAQFLAEYNERPHQGVSIPGLSPKELANRIWLM